MKLFMKIDLCAVEPTHQRSQVEKLQILGGSGGFEITAKLTTLLTFLDKAGKDLLNATTFLGLEVVGDTSLIHSQTEVGAYVLTMRY